MRWKVEVPTLRRERMRGLIGRDRLEPHHGPLLLRSRSVHTFGIRLAVLAVLLDGGLRVAGIKTLRLGQLLLPRAGVRHVLECAADADLHVGDRLRLEEDLTGRTRR
ncbi:MAG: DUF192 domain-containing protein [Actinomycetota bacterium]